MPRWLLVLLVLGGCAARPTPPQPRPVPPVASSPSAASAPTAAAPAPPQLTPTQAREEAERIFRAAGVESASDVPKNAAAFVAAGLDEQRTMRLVASLASACLAQDGRCEALHEAASDPSAARPFEILQLLLAQLGAVGTEAAIPLLARLDGRDVFRAEETIERILEARAARSLGKCEPPTPQDVAAQRAQVSDFTVVDHDGQRWVARAPTPGELDDLAYFFAALADAGSPVGTTLETGAGPLGPRAAADPRRAQWRDEAHAAWRRGDVGAHANAARSWLASLGYPGPLRAQEDGEMTWGGAGHSYVMRELGRSAEILGQLGEAAALYRRADPGGGVCGTSVPYRRMEQTRGLIRATEQQLGCRPVVPERLFSYYDFESDFYGPARLAKAGFDLARLYHGAALTWGRHIDRTELAATLASAPGSLATAAVARLEQRGPEAWDARVRGLEGLADTGGKAALPVIVRRATLGPLPERQRALGILQSMVIDTVDDPCKPHPSELYYSLGSIDSDARKVGSLNDSCPTHLTAAERAELVKELGPMLREKEPKFREQVVVALGRIGSRAAVPLLRPLLLDGYHPKGARICTISIDKPQTCRENWPIREAARTALATIERVARPPGHATR